MSEKRQFSRLPFEANVTMEFIHEDEKLDEKSKEALAKPNVNIPFYKGKSIVIDGELLDICLNGALINPDYPLPVKKGKLILLSIDIPQSSISVKFDSKLIHVKDGNVGFKFLGAEADSMIHLRKIIEYNLGDADRVSDELSFLISD